MLEVFVSNLKLNRNTRLFKNGFLFFKETHLKSQQCIFDSRQFSCWTWQKIIFNYRFFCFKSSISFSLDPIQLQLESSYHSMEDFNYDINVLRWKVSLIVYKWKYTHQKLVEMHQLIRKTKGALFLQCMGICTVDCNGSTSRVRNPMNYRSSIDFFPNNNNNTIKVLKQQWATTLVISDFGTGEHYLWAVSVREDGSNTLYIRFFSPGELTRLTQDSIY